MDNSLIDILQKYNSVNTLYGTDKNTSHSYGPIYESIFKEFRFNQNKILEIGFYSGASLQVYSEYFVNSQIYGIDIVDHCSEIIKQNNKIKLLFGDAKKRNIIDTFKESFNIIIEDASHLLEDQILFFKDYSDFVMPEGLYIIEDVHEQNIESLKNALNPLIKLKGFTLDIVDLRSVKNRFDDILFILKKNKLSEEIVPLNQSNQLVIFYLTSQERHYTFTHFIKLLNDSKYKNKWMLLVLTHSNDSSFYLKELQNVSITSSVVNIPTNNNYMNKVKYATSYAEANNYPYMMKCDNDIFLTANTLDYMIDNLHMLDNSKHLTIGPTLSSGIPGIEYFVDQYLSIEEQQEIKNMFLKTSFVNLFGANYTQLNKYTTQATKWDRQAFYEGVRALNHHYLGIHPIRVNYEAIHFLNNCILKNKENFFKSTPSSCIVDDDSPYLCDSIFCIRTNIYKNIIYDQSLFVDDFDEVPLNKYAWKNAMNHVFIEKGYAIHMLYNWYNNHYQYERTFCEKLFS